MTSEEIERDRYRIALRNVSNKDASKFGPLLKEGMRHLNLTNKDVARQFGVSFPTVERWLSGQTTPHEAMRVPVYNWLAKIMP